MNLTVPVSGRFWRITFAEHARQVLDGVRHPEGRYHHDGQPALYASPTPEFAAMAVDAYLRPGDPPRVICPLALSDARLCDLRDPDICATLGITPDISSVPWVPERAAGLPATSWAASDAVRATDADGMIYRARSYPDRWHIVLFRWNRPGRAQLALDAPPMVWENPLDRPDQG